LGLLFKSSVEVERASGWSEDVEAQKEERMPKPKNPKVR